MSDRYPFIIMSVFAIIFTISFFLVARDFNALGHPLAAIVPAFLAGLGGFWTVMSIAFSLRPDLAAKS